MTVSGVLSSVIVLFVRPIRSLLVPARWTALAPRAAIVLWQSAAFFLAIAAFGACAELASGVSSGAGPRRNRTNVSVDVVHAPAVLEILAAQGAR